ncbi:CRISPR system precrRNA processing endoribonuclease RAMP protein Cas6 [Candidatus Bipolaricaulota sp. J31]
MRKGPYALVLEFRGERPVEGVTPERLHAAFLGLVSRGDRTLGRLLHSPKLGRRPFSLYPLGRPGEDGKVRLRLAVLSPELFLRFWERWDKRGGIPLKLGKTFLPPVVIHTSGPWWGSCSWDELLRAEPRKEVELVFATPTSFKGGDLDLPLPVPRLVFGSLLAKWNAFAPRPFPISLEEIERRIALAEARIATRRFFDGRVHIVGFVGRARFRALRSSSPDLRRAMSTLAEFAFYAGVGRKATHGMGLVRVIDDEGATSY